MATLDDLIERLHGEGRLRVWSLAVTFFGDAVAPRGGSIAMSNLSEILERLGAESGAIRTAMSRLARDGWVERLRAGRRSYYALAGPGAETTRAASARIYAAAPPEWSGRWTVAIAPDGDGPPGFHKIAPGAWIAPDDPAAEIPEDAFLIRGGEGEAPDWARRLLSPPELADRYAAFDAAWSGFEPPEAPEDAMAARTLLIHDWRRILLRDAPLPRALRPRNWPGAGARETTAALYRALAPFAERWLDDCEAAPGRTMPTPGAGFHRRFVEI